ncbi:hypothetical protein [Segniliparus rugosus]|uniref:Pilin n=1 Tax=Segniliparus rugosus (strain ATCC BAA-974 / DSM 45345 / CCUG 50838 / CIP 108380 / JCM 13579 / CDC 945) TaxID=679197 RepID=E5XQB1_SEGRC|nr:hypothetical protein [Segniliparus rugosus]EFV13473.1 hypothetical protein HMPREF9336_01683 [Segniliparus rugosus ATCC BAA-974]
MKTIVAALFATALSGAALAAPSSALAAPLPAGQNDRHWCPGEEWNEEWGVNEQPNRCHDVDLDDDDAGLDPGVPDPDLGTGLPRQHPDGQYPPDYDWSEEYGDNHGGRHG